jgi:hypothetical protein
VDGRVEHIPPLWAQNLAAQPAGRRTILFLDELDKCPHETQNAALRIVRERQVGALRLPAGCRVVAAANPPYLGGWDLPSAMANRFAHLDWALDIPAVLEGLNTGFWPPIQVLQRDLAAQAEPLARWRGLTTAFLLDREDLVRDLAASVAGQGRAWPSPRSWEMLQRVMAVADTGPLDSELEKVLVGACVGKAAATVLLAWARPVRDASPERALANPAGYALPELATHVVAVIRMVAAAVAVQLTKERLDAAATLYERLYQHHAEAVNTAIRYLRHAIGDRPDLHI